VKTVPDAKERSEKRLSPEDLLISVITIRKR